MGGEGRKIRWRLILTSIAFVMAGTTLAVFAVWFEPERSTVNNRQEFAAWVIENGGSVTFVDPNKQRDPKVGLSWLRRTLGDRPVFSVGIPYKFSPDQLWDHAEKLYPEAEQISIAPDDPADPALPKLFGGEDSIEILKHPDQIEAHRLVPVEKVVKDIDDFPTAGAPIVLKDDLASRFSRDLASPASYGWGYSKPCIPAPGVRLTFLRSDDRIDVFFCFECDTIWILRNKQFVGVGQIDPGRNEFAAAMKAAFPGDQEIQSLRDKPNYVRHLRKPHDPRVNKGDANQ